MTSSAVDVFLQHHGVKGMKWGVRKKRSPKESPSNDSTRTTTLKKRAKRSGVKALSNAEIQDAINRMNLEQQFKRLKTNERSVVTRFIASTLLEIGTREVKQVVSNKIVSKIGKKMVA